MEPYRSYFPNAGLLLPHTRRVSDRVLVAADRHRGQPRHDRAVERHHPLCHRARARDRRRAWGRPRNPTTTSRCWRPPSRRSRTRSRRPRATRRACAGTRRGTSSIRASTATWAGSHAQVPTVLVKERVLRIYYADRDGDGRSFTTYLDVDRRDPGRVVYHHRQPLLPLGRRGTFDDDGMMPAWALEHAHDPALLQRLEPPRHRALSQRDRRRGQRGRRRHLRAHVRRSGARPRAARAVPRGDAVGA